MHVLSGSSRSVGRASRFDTAAHASRFLRYPPPTHGIQQNLGRCYGATTYRLGRGMTCPLSDRIPICSLTLPHFPHVQAVITNEPWSSNTVRLVPATTI